MQRLWLFLAKYYHVFLFIALEVVSFALMFKGNTYHQSVFFNSTNSIAAGIYKSQESITQYFSLNEKNKELHELNSALMKYISESVYNQRIDSGEVMDSVYVQRYKYVAAQVINNSTLKRNNFITINRGGNSAIERNMGIIGPDGVVGITKAVSTHFTSAYSILHKDVKISALVLPTIAFGSVEWDGKDPQVCLLKDIPLHVNIKVGDRVVTSGYSTIFPKGIPIGVVIFASKETGENFQDIKIKMSTDFNRINEVYVIRDQFGDEKNAVEEQVR